MPSNVIQRHSTNVTLQIERGMTFEWYVEVRVGEYSYQPIQEQLEKMPAYDLTNHTATMNIHPTCKSGEFPNMVLTDGNGITRDDEEHGVLFIELTDEQTATMAYKTAKFNVVVESPEGKKRMLAHGRIEVFDSLC